MRIRDHKPIIVKALKEAQTRKFASVEELAEHLILRVEQVEEVLSLYSNVGIVSSAPQAESTGAVLAPPQDPSERIVPNGNGEVQENFTKQEIRAFCDAHLPPKIALRPPGFERDVTLVRKLENAPGDLNFVRVKYVQPGADMGAETIVYPTEARLDAQKVMREINEAAKAVMSPVQRKVEPKFTSQPLDRLDPGRVTETGFGADVSETTGADMQTWSSDIASAEADPMSPGSLWRSQRG